LPYSRNSRFGPPHTIADRARPCIVDTAAASDVSFPVLGRSAAHHVVATQRPSPADADRHRAARFVVDLQVEMGFAAVAGRANQPNWLTDTNLLARHDADAAVPEVAERHPPARMPIRRGDDLVSRLL